MFSMLISLYLFLGLLTYFPLLYILFNSDSLVKRFKELIKKENMDFTIPQCKLICSIILFFLIPLLPIFVVYKYVSNGGI